MTLYEGSGDTLQPQAAAAARILVISVETFKFPQVTEPPRRFLCAIWILFWRRLVSNQYFSGTFFFMNNSASPCVCEVLRKRDTNALQRGQCQAPQCTATWVQLKF